MKDMIYFNCCVAWDPKDVHVDGGLCDMIDEEVPITRRTFLAHVDPTELHHVESMLGYAKHPRQGLTMAGDFHVSCHRSLFHGECLLLQAFGDRVCLHRSRKPLEVLPFLGWRQPHGVGVSLTDPVGVTGGDYNLISPQPGAFSKRVVKKPSRQQT